MAVAFILLALSILGVPVWLIFRAVKGKPLLFKAHTVTYVLACVAGVFTFAFFLETTTHVLVKVVMSIFLGMVVIVLAALFQRRRQQPDKT